MLLPLAHIIAAQAWIAIKTEDKKAKALSAALVLFALIIGWVRFGGGHLAA